MIKLYELAVTSLAYRVAQRMEDGTIKHFELPAAYNPIQKEDLRSKMLQTLKDKFGLEAEIERIEPTSNPNSTPFEVEDVTAKMSKNAQILLGNRIHSTVREYKEERPVENTLRAKSARFFKKLVLNVFWRFVHKYNPISYISNLVMRHYNLETKFSFYNLMDKWMNEIYLPRVSTASIIGISCTEEDLSKAYNLLSQKLEFQLGDSIKGSLAGVQKIALADVVGDGKKRYVVWCAIFVDQLLCTAIHTSKALKADLFIVGENDTGVSISPEPQIVTEVL